MKATLTYLRESGDDRHGDDDNIISANTTTIEQTTFQAALMDAYQLSMMSQPPSGAVELRVIVR